MVEFVEEVSHKFSDQEAIGLGTERVYQEIVGLKEEVAVRD